MTTAASGKAGGYSRASLRRKSHPEMRAAEDAGQEKETKEGGIFFFFFLLINN